MKIFEVGFCIDTLDSAVPNRSCLNVFQLRIPSLRTLEIQSVSPFHTALHDATRSLCGQIPGAASRLDRFVQAGKHAQSITFERCPR